MTGQTREKSLRNDQMLQDLMDPTQYSQLVSAVKLVRQERTIDTLSRRLMKIMEELGEVNEAYLGASSIIHNQKGKTWSNVREELADLFIVVTDCLLTPMPDDSEKTEQEIELEITRLVGQKIKKWQRLLLVRKNLAALK